jgi:hypothetical protein
MNLIIFPSFWKKRGPHGNGALINDCLLKTNKPEL